MKLKKIHKQFVLRFSGEFSPAVRIGTSVKVGSLLGTGEHYRILQEIPLQSVDKILVDDGIFVQKGEELASSVSFFKKRIFVADFDGLVRINNNAIQIVEVEPNYKFYSNVAGKVEYVNNEKIKIKATFYKFWLFASLGQFLTGELYFVNKSKPILTSKDIPSDIKGKIVVIPSFLTKKLIIKAVQFGAIGIIGSSIHYDEFKNLSNLIKYINLGILTGFGNLPILPDYETLLKMYDKQYVEVDFSREFMYMPIRELFAYKTKYYLFNASYLGVPINIVRLADNGYAYVKLPKNNKQLLVRSDEIFVL